MYHRHESEFAPKVFGSLRTSSSGETRKRGMQLMHEIGFASPTSFACGQVPHLALLCPFFVGLSFRIGPIEIREQDAFFRMDCGNDIPTDDSGDFFTAREHLETRNWMMLPHEECASCFAIATRSTSINTPIGVAWKSWRPFPLGPSSRYVPAFAADVTSLWLVMEVLRRPSRANAWSAFLCTRVFLESLRDASLDRRLRLWSSPCTPQLNPLRSTFPFLFPNVTWVVVGWHLLWWPSLPRSDHLTREPIRRSILHTRGRASAGIVLQRWKSQAHGREARRCDTSRRR